MSQINDNDKQAKSSTLVDEILHEQVSRREFLQIMGICGVGTALPGCDVATTVTIEEGKEDIVAYLNPGEYVVPGVGVWYASTCLQCPALCGIHGRVREGRVLKLEGNPDSPVSHGKCCQMGQAGLQNHFNPDRLLNPMIRHDGKLVESDWQTALELIKKHIGPTTELSKDQIAWFTGNVSGHQRVLIESHLKTLNSKQHFLHETVNNSVWQAACKEQLGDATPALHLNKAALIVSFGADFLGTWESPMHYSNLYSQFRSLPNRGALIQLESKMSLTGANADLWVSLRPGTEGEFALGLARYILHSGKVDSTELPDSLRKTLENYDSKTVSKYTGVSVELIERVGKALINRTPSLVIAGPSVGGQTQGYDAASAILMLNQLLGNIGKTIDAEDKLPLPNLRAKTGGTGDLLNFSNALENKKLKAIFFYGSNPIYSAPTSTNLEANLIKSSALKIVMSSFLDETAMLADVVLPTASYLEDWGTHVAAQGPGRAIISLQQPLMEKWRGSAKGGGDIFLELLKMAAPERYNVFTDYYAYLKNAIVSLHTELPADTLTDEQFWQQALQHGVIKITPDKTELKLTWPEIKTGKFSDDAAFPFYLVPSPRVGLFDGRHANLPWLQESPDQISKVVWDSWAEIHPRTAAKLGINHGDIIEVTSADGRLKVKAYLSKVVHHDVIAIPLGQGHKTYGRFASNVGVNPLKLISAEVEARSGELAMYGTRISLVATGKKDRIVRMGGSDTQQGRELVRTISNRQANNEEDV